MSIWNPERYDYEDTNFIKHLQKMHERVPMILSEALEYALKHTETIAVKRFMRTFDVVTTTRVMRSEKSKVCLATYSGSSTIICYLGITKYNLSFSGFDLLTWTDYDYLIFRLSLYFRYSCGDIEFEDDSFALSTQKSNIKSFLIELNKDYQDNSDTSIFKPYIVDNIQYLDRILEISHEEGFTELLTVILNITKDLPKEQPELRL